MNPRWRPFLSIPSLGFRILFPILLACLAPACRSSIPMAEAGADSAIDESGKVPTKAFLGNPIFSFVRLSPSGRRLALLTSREETDVLLAIDLGSGARTPLAYLERKGSIRSPASQRIESVGWASEHVVLMSSSRAVTGLGVRPRVTTLLASDLRDPRVRDLGKDWPYARFLQFKNRIISYLPDDPDRILINWFGQARTVDLQFSRLREAKLKRKGLGNWRADHEFKLRIGFSKARWSNAFEVWGRVSEEDRLERLVHWDPLDKNRTGEGFYFAGFSERPEKIYVASERETGRLALYEYDLADKRMGQLVFASPDHDVSRVMTSAVDGRLLSIGYRDTHPRIEYVDAEFRDLWAPIHRDFPDRTLTIVDMDRYEKTSIFAVSASNLPPVYYRLDNTSGEYSRLFRSKPALSELELPKTTPVTFRSRDGLEIHGYVTRPHGADGPNATVVFPHDRPFSRDVAGWNAVVQFLVSRGFTVFQLNYRGSTGYGRAFREAGYREYGRAMQDDITDGVRWLVAEGIADPDRIGIFGIGYGGYAALWGLCSTPDLYAAGASYAGISDLVTLLADDARGYVDDVTTRNKVLTGSRWSDRDYLDSVSPAKHADRIRVPVLLGHGTDDWDVHIRHTDQMTSALEDAGVEHEVYRYRGESHEFIDERTRIDFYQKLGAFFERTLKPDPALVLRPAATTG